MSLMAGIYKIGYILTVCAPFYMYKIPFVRLVCTLKKASG